MIKLQNTQKNVFLFLFNNVDHILKKLISYFSINQIKMGDTNEKIKDENIFTRYNI